MKLRNFGFRGIVKDFIKSYLTNRKKYVDLNGFKSNLNDMNFGVPQGSVLGPLLFNIFIDDFSRIDFNCKTILYADDSVFYVSDVSFEGCIEKLNNMITVISTWLVNNRILANTLKTKLMFISSKQVRLLPEIRLNGSVLEWVTHFKYLGFYIDDKLNFSFHSKYVYNNLSRLHGMIYSVSRVLPKHTLFSLYNSLIIPIITQNVIIWGGISKNNTDPISIKINKILRLILNIGYNENRIPNVSTNFMYKEIRYLKFKDVYRFHLLKFLHHALYVDYSFFDSYFSPLLPNHNYPFRNVRINLPYTRLQIGKNFTIFRVCDLINEIPEELLAQQSKASLKRKFYEYAIAKYTD